MKAYLLTYNQDNWAWPLLKDFSFSNGRENKHIERWSSYSRQVAIGDRVFLTMTGFSGKRGVFAAGHCVKESYVDQHYIKSKADSGETTSFIDVEFDWILNPFTDDILSLDF